MTLEQLLSQSIAKNASDLYISAGLAPIIRVDGELQTLDHSPVLEQAPAKSLLQSCMTDTVKKQFEQDLEVDFAIEIEKLGRFRVNAFHQSRGVAATFRPIPMEIPDLDQLGLPDILKTLCNLPRGIVLITGPTGSGKSTTVAAMIDKINHERNKHIITIEDPIEFAHHSSKSLIDQREVGRDTHSFATALRSALREAPDIIFVGEMRDLETIRLALTAAETGQLVFATLHTSSAPTTINRIIDVFPGDEKSLVRSMLSESLQAVICQTLLKKIGTGRVPAAEIMICTPAIRNLIREDKIAQMVSAMQTGSAVGMQTLDQDLKKLVSKKIIDLKTAEMVSVNGIK